MGSRCSFQAIPGASLRLGLLGARADVGGLSTLTWEFARHIEPERILGVDLGRPNDWERYGKGRLVVAPYEDMARYVPGFLKGLDAVYIAETAYWYPALDMARKMGVKTYLHVMPELNRYAREPDLPRPDVMLAPTTWETKDFKPVNLLHVPVATDRLPFKLRTKARRFLHVGAPAMLDRAGTQLLLNALRYCTQKVDITFRLAHAPGSSFSALPANVTARTVGASKNYWDDYADYDVLVSPRRYGGLHLTLQEALASGMAVIALDREPERGFLCPDGLIPTTSRHLARMQGGKIPVEDADPKALADKIDSMAGRDTTYQSRFAELFADAYSWTNLLPQYRERICAPGVT